MIKTGFSFCYGGKQMSFEGAGKHVIDDNLTVTAERKEYPEFDACEWVLWFENNSDGNSRIISDINDCDVCYQLKNAQPKDPVYRVTEGFPCITVMNGMVGSNTYGHSAYHYDDRDFDNYPHSI